MALIFEFSEEYKESRGVSISNDAFDQDFSFFIWGNFVESADIDSTYGPDDDIQALEAAYSIIPPWRIMPMYDGNLILLTLNSLELKQLQTDHWKVTVKYSIPEYGGATGGGYNEPVDPVDDNGTQWTNNFVQIGFDIRTESETRTMSRELLSLAKDFNVPALPYLLPYGAPMGVTKDGVEGVEVYTRSFEFNVTAYFTPAQLTYAYVRRLYRMTTSVSIRPFFGFPPGSVMFMGTGGQGDLFSVIPMTFNFVMKPNFMIWTFGANGSFEPNSDDPKDMADIIIDSSLPSILPGHPVGADNTVPWLQFDSNDPFNYVYNPLSKTMVPGPVIPLAGGGMAALSHVFSGWSHIDYRYGPEFPDPVTGAMIQNPIYRLIHMNYPYSDFKTLGI